MRDLDWMERGNCRGTDGDSFFPEKTAKAITLRVCMGCEVRAECLEYALAEDIRFGIWGGKTERQRTRLRKSRQLAEAA